VRLAVGAEGAPSAVVDSFPYVRTLGEWWGIPVRQMPCCNVNFA